MREFNFLPQSDSIEKLLQVCVEVLPHLPQAKQSALASALEKFETRVAPTMWSVEDLNVDWAADLSDEDKLAALAHFFDNYECTSQDWLALEWAVEAVANTAEA